jgi:tripeptidyl-peptidase-1
LTHDEVNKLVKPTDEALEFIHDWLSDAGIETSTLSYSPAKDWIKVSLPVGEVESLLNTKYSVFEHESNGGYIVRTLEYSLLLHLPEHVAVI